jgi:hypothetical protein
MVSTTKLSTVSRKLGTGVFLILSLRSILVPCEWDTIATSLACRVLAGDRHMRFVVCVAINAHCAKPPPLNWVGACSTVHGGGAFTAYMWPPFQAAEFFGR